MSYENPIKAENEREWKRRSALPQWRRDPLGLFAIVVSAIFWAMIVGSLARRLL